MSWKRYLPCSFYVLLRVLPWIFNGRHSRPCALTSTAPSSSFNSPRSLTVASPARLCSLGDSTNPYVQHHSDSMADTADPTGSTVNTVPAGIVHLTYLHGDHKHKVRNIKVADSLATHQAEYGKPTSIVAGTIYASHLLARFISHHYRESNSECTVPGGELSKLTQTREPEKARIDIVLSDGFQIEGSTSGYTFHPSTSLQPDGSGNQTWYRRITVIPIRRSDVPSGHGPYSYELSELERQIQKEWLPSSLTVPGQKPKGLALVNLVKRLHAGLREDLDTAIEQGVMLSDGTTVIRVSSAAQ